MLGKQLTQAAAGSAAGEALYVDDVFSIDVYEGNDGSQTFSNGLDLAEHGGLTWFKRRSSLESHALFDSERGGFYALNSDTTNAQALYGGVSWTPTSDGFTINGSNPHTNASGETYVAWTFRRAPKFFDIVTYTGNGTSGHQIAHALDGTVGMIMIKRLNATLDWRVYHRTATGNSKYLTLNTSAAPVTASDVWNNTTPTSTHFTLGNSPYVNQNGSTFVAYIFAHNAGGFGPDGTDNIISMGGFAGNNFPQTSMGWEPQHLIFKRYDSTDNWEILDNIRGIYSGSGSPTLYGDTTSAEYVSTTVNLLATGFDPGSTPFSSGTYAYMAIRRPHKPPTDATEVFNTATYTGDGTNNRLIDSGTTVDLFWTKTRSVTSNSWASSVDRMRGGDKELRMNGTNAEINFSPNYAVGFDQQTGVEVMEVNNNYNQNGVQIVNYHFRRAPGFLDIVTYEGNSTGGRTVAHNLGSQPEMIIVKKLNNTGNWFVYHHGLGATKALRLNLTNAEDTSTTYFNDTEPTSTEFTVGTSQALNGNGDSFVAYLFASLDGISKVGTYTGTASAQDIDCGFTNGARFVMIKRTNGAGGPWIVFDSARGINVGSDPYILLNSTDAEGSAELVAPLSSGFSIANTADGGVNQAGDTYLYLAIA